MGLWGQLGLRRFLRRSIPTPTPKKQHQAVHRPTNWRLPSTTRVIAGFDWAFFLSFSLEDSRCSFLIQLDFWHSSPDQMRLLSNFHCVHSEAWPRYPREVRVCLRVEDVSRETMPSVNLTRETTYLRGAFQAVCWRAPEPPDRLDMKSTAASQPLARPPVYESVEPKRSTWTRFALAGTMCLTRTTLPVNFGAHNTAFDPIASPAHYS